MLDRVLAAPFRDVHPPATPFVGMRDGDGGPIDVASHGGCLVQAPRSRQPSSVQALAPSALETGAKQWIRLVQSGDEVGLRSLYTACGRRVFACAQSIVRREDVANEVVSTTFMQIWTNASTFDPDRGSALAWITLIARSRAFDALRRLAVLRQYEVSFDDEEPSEMASDETAALPLLHLERHSRRRRIQRAMSRLSSIQRQVICMTTIDGLSHDEVSRHLQLPLGTVKSHVKRGLASLRLRLEATGSFAQVA